MDVDKTLSFIENSFLKPLLFIETTTDISYNGESIFYEDNDKGRLKSEIEISQKDARDFIRQIAFLTEKQFSYQSPELDVTVSRYRINAVHQTIGRVNNEQALTFEIRIASYSPKFIKEQTIPNELSSLFDVLLRSKQSIMIAGVTGSGKTELQKYLIRSMKKNTRVIIIDNVLELEQVREDKDLDINTWQVDERNNTTSIQNLVKTALRSNPDWLIVAESRGKEMLDVLNSMMTGHPIITTIHAFDVESMLKRSARMVMMNEQKMDIKDVIDDLLYHLHYYVYLEKEYIEDFGIKRYVKAVNAIDQDGNVYRIYRYENEVQKFEKLPKTLLKLLKYSDNDSQFIDCFVQSEDSYE